MIKGAVKLPVLKSAKNDKPEHAEYIVRRDSKVHTIRPLNILRNLNELFLSLLFNLPENKVSNFIVNQSSGKSNVTSVLALLGNPW